MNEDITLDELITNLGGTPSVPEDPPPAQDPAPVEPPVAEEPPAGNPPPADEGNPPPAEPTEPTEPAEPAQDVLEKARANEAFAQMRIQNKQLTDTLKNVAGLLGIEGQPTEEQLLVAIQEKALQKQAQDAKVPVDLLRRLKLQEDQLAQYSMQQKQSNIEAGFERVKQTFNLNQQQLNTFAADLVNKGGINPYAQDVDFVQAYRTLHFDDIVAAEVAKAVAAEQTRAAAAKQQSSTPATKTNPTIPSNGEQAQINSVQGLAEWFKQQTQ